MTEMSKNVAPYSIGFIGWGLFEIPITVEFMFKTGRREKLELNHFLSFEGKGSWKTIEIEFDKNLI